MGSFEDIINASEWEDEEIESMLFGTALLKKHDPDRSSTIYQMFFGREPEREEESEPVYSCEAHKRYAEEKTYKELQEVYAKRRDHFERLFAQLKV